MLINSFADYATVLSEYRSICLEKSTAGIMTLAIVYADLQDNVTCQITIGSNVFGFVISHLLGVILP